MERRDVDITFPSAKALDNVRPVVCFRWSTKGDKAEYIEADQVRMQRTSSGQQPATLKISATIPYLGSPPPGAEHTSDNAAAIAEIRALLIGPDDKPIDDVTTKIGVVGQYDYCNVPTTGARTDGGSVAPSAFKNWQPPGGDIEFIATTSKTIPNDALIRACFRWKLAEGDPGKFSESPGIRVLDRQPNSIKITVTVPHLRNQPPRPYGSKGQDARVGSYALADLLVPQADVRVLVLDPELNQTIDGWATVGLTSVWFASFIALLTVSLSLLSLWAVSRRRFASVSKTMLFLITTRRGFASLSQFQIILWTFIVVASAVYVIALSGDLIPITAGTLVLLGISGAATVIAKAKSENDAVAPPPPLDPAKAEADAQVAERYAQNVRGAATVASPAEKVEANLAAEEAEAKARVARAKAVAAEAIATAARKRSAVTTAPDKQQAEAEARAAEEAAEEKRKAAAVAEAEAAAAERVRHPRWSDLVMEEIQGRELDVTRVQMLFFTLVTASFVVLKVVTSYEIPIIPEGYLILMGISNSVYVGSKFAANPAAKP
jgi:hypothetical protein